MSEAQVVGLQLRTSVEDLLRAADIANVRVVACSASLKNEEQRSPGSASIQVAPAYRAYVGGMSNRFDYEVTIADRSGEDLAEITFTIAVEYVLPEGFEPDAEAVDYVCGTTGYFAAYPYAREVLQSLTSRLQLDPITMGLLHDPSMFPDLNSLRRPNYLAEPTGE
jgi:hypothetical protein